jgi:FkbM family methyltransferase
MFVNRWLNYFLSLPTLFFGIKNFPSIALHFFINRTISAPVTLKMHDGVLLNVYTAMDVWTAKEIYLDKDYERYSLPIQDGWTIIDIGAAFGDFVILSAKHTRNTKIYAFEPYPKYFKLLKKNIRLNRLKNVSVYPYAVGAKAEKLVLDTGSGEAVTFSTSVSRTSSSSSGLAVESKSLKQIFKEEKIRICDYMKVDCEGGEYAIFFATPDAILSKIRYICMEYHDAITKYKGIDLARFLKKKGFKVTLSVNPYRHELGFLFASNKSL